jgi:hypothetical protein
LEKGEELMHLALIPPISLLDYTDRTEFQLMLPQLIEDDRYEYTYRHHCKDPNQFVILDNGAAEGVEFDPKLLLAMAKGFKVDEVVVPDVIQDSRGTATKAAEFFPIARNAYWEHERWDERPKFMYVVQGKTTAEFRESIHWAAGTVWIDTIGIPRHAIETLEHESARYDLARYARSISRKPIHLLGASHLVATELKMFRWRKLNIRSTDTSSPFNFAYADRGLRLGNHVKRPDNYFNLPVEEFSEHYMEKNVESLIRWVSEA